ncbi:MAG: ferrous iron transport protein B [Saprospiraceae bacterium]|nr:ferrous iron transport protein B [Saprospiraceae bacterium]HRK80281.1 ferrous iron transport protein B [Saprospiraceae bacterium]
MSGRSSFTIALVGNPNCGKSSIFNRLTGLNQKIGNFPGVTVDKKQGVLRLSPETEANLIDFPGAYSFYPNSQDERIVAQTFAQTDSPDFPDAVVYVADVTRLEKHLLLFSQIRDLGLPVVLALNMADVAQREGLQVDTGALAGFFKTPVVLLSGRTGAGIPELRSALLQICRQGQPAGAPHHSYQLSPQEHTASRTVTALMPGVSGYQALLIAHHYEWLPFLSEQQREQIAAGLGDIQFNSVKSQVEETLERYSIFSQVVSSALRRPDVPNGRLTAAMDRVLTHRVAGPIIFFALMALIFQSIFAWATYPMDWIEQGFGMAEGWLAEVLPEGWVNSLVTEGILAGLGGILVFVPQIAILFFLISLLEEVGYMARAAFIFDRLMRWFGLNGRSIVALISGGACAIPAIMSTRTISNWKERLITILVTPFISCSARIPVYTVLIGFAVPSKTMGGFFNLQGLAFLGLYLLGLVAALLAGWTLKTLLKSKERSFLMLELPQYRTPVLRNVGLTVWEKVRAFVVEAGTIIMLISLILWGLSSYGPSNKMQLAEQEAIELAASQQLDETGTQDLIAAHRIEASWAGHLGKWIEPAIEPLGFDWKIGIALITSFAAREVFVGTMATIYSIGSSDDELSVRQRMAKEINPRTGLPVYGIATAFSLLIFYVLAMQCMSTLAVVKRETNSWKWPLVQFFAMTTFAYLASWATYQLLS